MLRKPTLLSLSKFMLSVYSHMVSIQNVRISPYLYKYLKNFMIEFIKKIINILNFSQEKEKRKNLDSVALKF